MDNKHPIYWIMVMQVAAQLWLLNHLIGPVMRATWWVRDKIRG